jgi:4-diphosphocytidyl-2-C-methyl-D-erythritol kinase
MVAVGLFDSLELADDPSGAVVLSCDSPALSAGPDNLVCRAAELIRRRHGVERGVRIRLRKRIPMAAGLAGGSSDAAGTLAGLERLWRLGLSPAALAALGAELGSDVSFFLAARAGWCTGRGEVVEPLRPGRALHLVLACPPAGLSTAAVFRALKLPDRPLDGGRLREAFVEGDVDMLGRLLFNRLEPAAIDLCPAVGRLHARLAAAKPAGVLMSGSGSTVFALCRDAAEAVRITRALSPAREGGDLARVCVVRSCD